MTDTARDDAPSADDIQRLFRRPHVVALRPMVWTGITALRVVRRFGWSADGLEHVEAIDEPVVFAANHISHADTAAIVASLPRAMRRRTAVAAALDVFGGGGLRLRHRMLPTIVAAGFNAFAFDRHGPPLRSIRTSVQLLRSGWNLLLYPEGTRSRTGEMAEFKVGASVLAKFSRRPVVPIHVSGGQDVMPCGVSLPQAGHLRVSFGAPMLFGRDDTPTGFARRLEDRVRELGPPGTRPATSSTDAEVVYPEPEVREQPA